jgi:hypothetical protein
MESSGEPLKIQISEETHKHLAKDTSFELEHRGTTEFKVFFSHSVQANQDVLAPVQTELQPRSSCISIKYTRDTSQLHMPLNIQNIYSLPSQSNSTFLNCIPSEPQRH